jgi:hypothetical protein
MKDGTEHPVEVEVKNEVPRPPQAKIEEEITKSVEAKEVVERKEVKEAAAPKELVINEQTPATVATEVVENPKADPVYIPQTLKNTQAFFSLYNAANGLVLDGEVEVIDTERATLLSKMKANSYLTVPDPISKSGKLSLIGSAFGFQKIQHEMNYHNTEADTLQEAIDLIGNLYMVKFDLSRIVKGNIATLYNCISV